MPILTIITTFLFDSIIPIAIIDFHHRHHPSGFSSVLEFLHTLLHLLTVHCAQVPVDLEVPHTFFFSSDFSFVIRGKR